MKSFYKANWRELNSNVGKNLSLPEAKKRTPKMQDLLELDEAMSFQRDKAILWFLESAPFRQGTVTRLLWRDLKPTKQMLKETREESQGQIKRTVQEDEQIAKLVPYYLIIEAERLKGAGKGKYKGVKQVAFLHYFAVEKLERYKLELKKYGIEPKPDSPIFVAYGNNIYNRGKGDRFKGINVVFMNACTMAWNDENKKFSPQDMRDVLQSALEKVEVNPNLISPLLAHKVKGVDKHYSTHDIDEFLQVFVKALPLLVPQTVEEVKAETQKKIEEEQKRLVNLEFDNNNLKGTINSLNTQQQTQKEQISSMYDFVHKNLDTALDALDLICRDPEGAKVWLKIQAKKLDKEREKATVEEANNPNDPDGNEAWRKTQAKKLNGEREK